VAVVREETLTDFAGEEVVVGRALEVIALVAVVVATGVEEGGADEEVIAELTELGTDVVVAIGIEEEVTTGATIGDEEEEIAAEVVEATKVDNAALNCDASG
jgi:hypothetical protein